MPLLSSGAQQRITPQFFLPWKPRHSQSEIPGALRVILRTSVMQYKGTKKLLPEIAREHRVDGVIEPTFPI
jgi:hypothetical protein